MQVRLEVAHQKANVKKVVLKQDATIGRSSECSLRIASSLVSRQHCKFTLTEDSVLVRDLGSSNGTFVNGLRLEPQQDYEIAPDSQLSVGGVLFVVRFTLPARPPAVADPPGSTVDLPAIQPGRGVAGDLTAEWSPGEVAAGSGNAAGSGKSKAARSPVAKAPSEVPPGLAETATFSGLPPADAASVSPALAHVAAVANAAGGGLGDSAVGPIVPVMPVADAADVDADSQTISATPEQIAAALASVGIAPARPPRVDPLSDDHPHGDDDTLGDGTSPYYAEEEIGDYVSPVEEAPVVVGIDAMARDAIPVAAGASFDAASSSPAPALAFDFESPTAAPGAIESAEAYAAEEFAEAPNDTVDESPEPLPDDGSAESAVLDTPAPETKRGGLFSLFGLFGKKSTAPPKRKSPVAESFEPDVGSGPHARFVSDDSTPEFVAAEPVLAEPVLAEEAVPAYAEPVADGAIAWASPVAGSERLADPGPIESATTFDNAPEPIETGPAQTDGAAPAVGPPPDDDGFNDFLKQMGH